MNRLNWDNTPKGKYRKEILEESNLILSRIHLTFLENGPPKVRKIIEVEDDLFSSIGFYAENVIWNALPFDMVEGIIFIDYHKSKIRIDSLDISVNKTWMKEGEAE